jgi:hypothetical protein
MRGIKRRMRDFVQWNVLNPLEKLGQEQIYQQIFAQQCANWNIRNDFYPLGGAAGYSLLYLLARLLTENRFSSILEFGSGQTTILIDRLAREGTRHVAYEDDPAWHAVTSARIQRCDYRLRPLEQRTIDGIPCATYADGGPEGFDLMLIDGPLGTPQFSRFGCVEPIRANPQGEFVIVFDDCDRPGEVQTIEFVQRLLTLKGIAYTRRDLGGRTPHAVLATRKFDHILYYW